MGLLLILIQVALLVLHYGAHMFRHVSPWALWLPAILFGVLWVIALIGGSTFNLASFNYIFVKSRR